MNHSSTRMQHTNRLVRDAISLEFVFHADDRLDNPDKVEGAPGSVQIMGKPMKDEELVEIMKVVEDILEKAS